MKSRARYFKYLAREMTSRARYLKYLARDFISRARYLKFRFDLACFSLMDDFITDLSLDYFTARVATSADVGKMYSHTACIPNALP